jgi:hypothetical protein
MAVSTASIVQRREWELRGRGNFKGFHGFSDFPIFAGAARSRSQLQEKKALRELRPASRQIHD